MVKLCCIGLYFSEPVQALTKNIVSTPELKHSTPTKPPLETEVDIFDDDFDLFSQPTKSKKKPKVGLQL